MLEFGPDPNITGGSIDNWYVDDKNSGIRTPTYQPSTVPQKNIDLGVVGFPKKAISEKAASLEEIKCNQRLNLLARSYAESEQSNYWRDLQARITILETELEAILPRYTESDWALLEQFKISIDKITKG